VNLVAGEMNQIAISMNYHEHEIWDDLCIYLSGKEQQNLEPIEIKICGTFTETLPFFVTMARLGVRHAKNPGC
jgi:hypothetical protein